jgi:hypothetical protein
MDALTAASDTVVWSETDTDPDSTSYSTTDSDRTSDSTNDGDIKSWSSEYR